MHMLLRISVTVNGNMFNLLYQLSLLPTGSRKHNNIPYTYRIMDLTKSHVLLARRSVERKPVSIFQIHI